MRSSLFTFSFYRLGFRCEMQDPLVYPESESFSPVFCFYFPTSFVFRRFTLKSVVCCELILVEGERCRWRGFGFRWFLFLPGIVPLLPDCLLKRRLFLQQTAFASLSEVVLTYLSGSVSGFPDCSLGQDVCASTTTTLLSTVAGG